MKKKLIISAVIFSAVTAVYSILMFSLSGNREVTVPQIFLTDIFLALLFAAAVLAFCLRASLSRSLYSYRNLLYIGGIIYSVIQLAVLLVYFGR